jgi:hypothetical protein
MSAKGGYGDQSGPPRSGGYGGPPRGGGYGGPPPHSRGPPQSDRHDSYGGGDRYGRSAPQSSYGAPTGYGDECMFFKVITRYLDLLFFYYNPMIVSVKVSLA